MKILYESNYINSFKSFSEVYSVSTNYHRIKKNGYFVNTNVILSFVIYFIVGAILSYLYLDFIFVKNNTQPIAIIFAITFVFLTIIYALALMGAFSQYRALRKKIDSNKKKKKYTLTIDEEGIKDNTNVICISSKWNNINCIVIGKYSICILTEASIYYIFPISIKDKLLSGVDKYNSNKKIKIIKSYTD